MGEEIQEYMVKEGTFRGKDHFLKIYALNQCIITAS